MHKVAVTSVRRNANNTLCKCQLVFWQGFHTPHIVRRRYPMQCLFSHLQFIFLACHPQMRPHSIGGGKVKYENKSVGRTTIEMRKHTRCNQCQREARASQCVLVAYDSWILCISTHKDYRNRSLGNKSIRLTNSECLVVGEGYCIRLPHFRWFPMCMTWFTISMLVFTFPVLYSCC